MHKGQNDGPSIWIGGTVAELAIDSDDLCENGFVVATAVNKKRKLKFPAKDTTIVGAA